MKIEPESFPGSVLIALGAFAFLLLLDPNHPFRLDRQAVPGAFAFACAVVAAIQIQARTKRPVRSFLYVSLASAVLLRLLCSIAGAHPNGNTLRLALIFWGSLTLIGIGGVIALERADRSPPAE